VATPGISSRLFSVASKHRFIRSQLFRAYDWAQRRNRPFLSFERDLGIDTRGFLPNHALRSGKAQDSESVAYLGAMPSVTRAALRELGDVTDAHFIDIGAGKGRVLAVAAEFPFASITGIELNPDLCAMTRRTAAVLAARYPGRLNIRVVEGDASDPVLPNSGTIVAFAYHPFGADLVRRLLDKLAGAGLPAYFVYVNPVHGAVADSHQAFARFFAGHAPCDAEERSISGEDGDAVVIWRAGEDAARPACPGADAAIQVLKDGWKASLG